jgi:hypothetical protein
VGVNDRPIREEIFRVRLTTASAGEERDFGAATEAPLPLWTDVGEQVYTLTLYDCSPSGFLLGGRSWTKSMLQLECPDLASPAADCGFAHGPEREGNFKISSCRFADHDLNSVFLGQSLYSTGDVYGVADCRITQSVRRPDIADHGCPGI